MLGKDNKAWFKHADFIVLDILALQLAFVLGFGLHYGEWNPFRYDSFQYAAVILFSAQIIVDAFSFNYKNILRRESLEELAVVVRYIMEIFIVSIAYLFLIRRSNMVSRIHIGLTCLLFIPCSWTVRCLNRKRIFHHSSDGITGGIRSIVLITTQELVETVLKKLTKDGCYHDFFIARIYLLEGEKSKKEAGEKIHAFRSEKVYVRDPEKHKKYIEKEKKMNRIYQLLKD